MRKQYFYWIDWMKTIGMFFIIMGHIMPWGYWWIYAFNVPLFFIISGFLGHPEQDIKSFYTKSKKSLVIPCIVILLIIYPFEVIFACRAGTFEWSQIPEHFFNCIVGNQGYRLLAGGLDVCWFIYTLFLCKLIQQLTKNTRIFNFIIVVFFLLAAIWYNVIDFHLHNAVVNVCLAYLFYFVGGGIKCMKDKANSMPSLMAFLMIIMGSAAVLYVGLLNGTPWMFDNTYGKNLILFLVGALAGTCAVFGSSCLLKGAKLVPVCIISKGSIVILGFHTLFIRLYDHIPDSYHNILTDYLVGFLILIVFVPIILLVERYLPILLGGR